MGTGMARDRSKRSREIDSVDRRETWQRRGYRRRAETGWKCSTENGRFLI